MSSKRLSIFVLCLVAIAFASSASACEICKTLMGGQVTCWSGAPKGADWCFGGFGQPCQTGGDCVIPGFEGGITIFSVLPPSERVCTDGPLGCSATALDREHPAGGFALERTTKAVSK